MRAHRMVVLAAVAGLAAPAGAWADGTAAEHAAEDTVHAVSVEPTLASRTRAVTAGDVGAAAAAVTGTEQDVGRWGAVVDWPVVGVHVALLPNGKVLAYDSVGDNATETYTDHTFARATVWDPATGAHKFRKVGLIAVKRPSHTRLSLGGSSNHLVA